jgi:hypothetical protein
MPCPKDIKGIRSFLGHASFYRRFIKDFSKISRPLTNLLQQDVPFVFDDDCVEAFETLKKALISAPIVQPPDWNLPLEIMCDASDWRIALEYRRQADNLMTACKYGVAMMPQGRVLRNRVGPRARFSPPAGTRSGADRAGFPA